ncbi:MAG: hypothetical protein J6D20_01600 [Clostridia bacterium]|nr:hypothetical protein [Clostridia bacterium]
MRKFATILLLILSTALCFSSCTSDETEAPDGLQTVKISEAEGYQFFGPEEWIIANDGDIAATYVAVGGAVKASLSFTKVDIPTGTLKEYFEREKPLFAYEISVKEEPNVKLGNSDGENYSVVYTFNYNETDYACMQIFAKHRDGFYIFTYTAEGDPTSEESYYQRYIEAVRLSAESLKFTEKSGAAPSEDSGAGSDEYKLVSDKDIAGFELYLPGDYAVISSDAYVSAKISEGANLFISEATDTNVSVLDYLKNRKAELKGFADNVTDIKITLKTQYDPESKMFEGWSDTMTVMPEYDEKLVFGNLDDNRLIAYEYTYEVSGNKYHVYQVLGIKSALFDTTIGAAGYVFTYTAAEDEYAQNIDEIQNILQRIKF